MSDNDPPPLSESKEEARPMTIVKVQLPVSSHSSALALVYDKGHERVSHQPLNAATISAMHGHPKAFFEAEWRGDRWQLGPRTEWQDW